MLSAPEAPPSTDTKDATTHDSYKHPAGVTLLRHAETDFNTGADKTSRNVSINSVGEAQATALTGHFDIVLCSPMRRCKQTLTLSSITYDTLEECAACREHIVNACDLLEGEDEALVGESEASILARVAAVKATVWDLVKAQPALRVLVVSHADFCWFLTSTVTEYEEEEDDAAAAAGTTAASAPKVRKVRERFGTWMKNATFLHLPPKAYTPN